MGEVQLSEQSGVVELPAYYQVEKVGFPPADYHSLETASGWAVAMVDAVEQAGASPPSGPVIASLNVAT